MSRQSDQDAKPSSTTAREAAGGVVERLQKAGFTAYFAGGCVRDQLLGIVPLDFDVATDARPEQVGDIFPRVQRVGEQFGVMLVREQGQQIEVASFRKDGVYSDKRRPDEIEFTDAEHDARRRDFTINGMFYDPVAEELIDFVKGRDDLESKLIRAIGVPQERFEEDHLRVLRAVRFAARFGFAIETRTGEAIRAEAAGEDSGGLAGVSRERIGQEVRLMLRDGNRAVAAWELQYYGLDRIALDEPGCLHAPTRLGRLPEQVKYATALGAWMLDRRSGSENHQGEQPEEWDIGAASRRWSRALMLSNAERAELKAGLQAHRKIYRRWDQAGVAEQKRMAATEHFREAILLVQTVDRVKFVAVQRRVSELALTGLAPEPLLTGDHLISMGMEPGPEFKSLLEAVYDAQLEGSVRTREEGEEMAKLIEQTRGG